MGHKKNKGETPKGPPKEPVYGRQIRDFTADELEEGIRELSNALEDVAGTVDRMRAEGHPTIPIDGSRTIERALKELRRFAANASKGLKRRQLGS